jgi:hypothetical protein
MQIQVSLNAAKNGHCGQTISVATKICVHLIEHCSVRRHQFHIQFMMAENIVRKQFDYYLAHQEELVREYNGKVIVMVNYEVVGAYATEDEAYIEAIKKYKLGTFMIQLCTPGPDAYTIRTHTRYVFE